jgi:hypothetical protein
MAKAVHVVVMVLLCATFLIPLAISPPSCLFAFLIAAIVPFLAAQSRRVDDPIASIPEHTVLSPEDFHAWARLVCASDRYEAEYSRHIYDARRGFDQKLPVVFSQIKAINYIHAWKVLSIVLLGLLAFGICDVFFAAQSVRWREPVASGLAMGVIWGYSLGLYRLWRVCRRYKSTGDLPL